MEIVEKQASKCCLNIQQSEISRNSANVAVRILGTDFPEEIVTVTAHYDSVPEGPGAYDNMSGGAMVMESFSSFRRAQTSQNYGVHLVWLRGKRFGWKPELCEIP
ncbi:MAG: M28 family peptidase [Blautia wexlerae]